MHVKKRLLRNALITAPIIAFYGIAPLVLFVLHDFLRGVLGFAFLSLFIYLIWRFNIYLALKPVPRVRRYVLSYFGTLLAHITILAVIPQLTRGISLPYFFLYPILGTLPINSIILVIINSEMLRTRKEQAEAENKELMLGNLEAQKQALLQQLQPHFLFNALSVLKSLITERPEAAVDYTVRLSGFLRYGVQAHQNELVSLAQELQYTEDYIALQQLRFGNALIFELAVPPSLHNRKLPVFALQTLVENAIKHNAFTASDPLVIRITVMDNRLVVTNNRVFKPTTSPPGTGLRNLRDRYRLIAGQPLEIAALENSFTVYLNLLPA